MPTREVVVVASSRTGLAKSFRGSFNLTRPDDMAAHCIKDVLRKVPQLDPAEVEDVMMGTGFPEGPQGFNVGRNVALMAGLPVTVPGGRSRQAAARIHAPSTMSPGVTSWLMSMTCASGRRSRRTPFIAATYWSRWPKSLRSATTGRVIGAAA